MLGRLAGPRQYSKRVVKLRNLCKEATITIPPSLYVKHKTDDELAEALEALLEKHGLSADSGGCVGSSALSPHHASRQSVRLAAVAPKAIVPPSWSRIVLAGARSANDNPCRFPGAGCLVTRFSAGSCGVDCSNCLLCCLPGLAARAGKEEVAKVKRKLALQRDLDGIDTSNIIFEGGRRRRQAAAAPVNYRWARQHSEACGDRLAMRAGV